MKKTFAFLSALLLLISLASCGAAPAQEEEKPDGSESRPAGEFSSAAAADDTLTPVTTEEEVRALYAADGEAASDSLPVRAVTPYEGDFLVQLGGDGNDGMQYLDWVYGQSGIRRRMLCLGTPVMNLEITGPASLRVVTGGPNAINGVPGFPHIESVSLSLIYDEQGMPLNYDAYGSGATSSSDTYWAGAGESYYMGMQGRREAVRSAQVDAGGVTVAFAPLADGSDFTAAYCEIPYTEVSLPENGNMLFVTFHDTFLDSGELAEGVTTDYLHSYGSLYPEDFPAGELSGSCVLIKKAEITQEGNNVVLTLTLDTDRLSEDPLTDGDGYFQFTAGTGCTGVADNGPYFRLQLRITNPLFDY